LQIDLFTSAFLLIYAASLGKKKLNKYPEPQIEHAGQVSTDHAAGFPRTGPIVVTSLQVWCRNGNARVKGLICSRQFRLGCLVDEIWANEPRCGKFRF